MRVRNHGEIQTWEALGVAAENCWEGAVYSTSPHNEARHSRSPKHRCPHAISPIGAHVYVTRGERSNRVYECIGIVGSIIGSNIVADEPEEIETVVAKGRPLMQQRRKTPASFWDEMLRIKMSHAAAVLNGKSRRASWISIEVKKHKFARLEVMSRPIYALVEIRAATCSLSLHGQTFRIGWLNGSTGDV